MQTASPAALQKIIDIAARFIDERELVINITDDFKDDSTIAKQFRGIYARGNMLNSRSGNCKGKVKKQLFLSYCESFFHCAALWDNFMDTVLTQLHVAHNNIFRLLFRLLTKCTTYNCLVKHIHIIVIRQQLGPGTVKTS